MTPSSWLEELANAEIALEQTGEIDAFSHHNEEKILKDHALSFLKELREVIQQYAASFNQFRKDPRQTIKVYGIAQTEADFLVFRNSLKLVIAYSKPGQVEISFHTLSGGLFAPQKRTPSRNKLGILSVPRPPGEPEKGDLITIELGTFNEAIWMFNGNRVEAKTLARFYLTEFIKNSVS